MVAPSRILVVRNDKLGDFMLALPALALLKQRLPDVHIGVVVPHYTREMAEACPWINEVIVDPGGSLGNWHAYQAMIRKIHQGKYDAVLTLFSTTRIGFALRAARIPERLAPATKVAQYFYNHRLVQRRSQSIKPEFAYNCDLVRHFLSLHGVEVSGEMPAGPYLQFPDAEMDSSHLRLAQVLGVDRRTQWVFVHPGSGGSASNLTLAQYAELIIRLSLPPQARIVVTAGPTERPLAESLRQMLRLSGVDVLVYHSTVGLRRFALNIASASVFIGGSTGPLHIAGALDVPTAAFYPRGRVTSALRWQTLNRPERRLAFAPPEPAAEDDMSAIDLGSAATVISGMLARTVPR
ncbi:MAG: glycosyltransferase family 9 protein [Gammaproteobacteria bacterium]|nr:glycosyltransferase family 9 protein [Gammaproteobacteria bacterium]